MIFRNINFEKSEKKHAKTLESKELNKKKTVILQRYNEMEILSLLHNCILAASKRNGARFLGFFLFLFFIKTVPAP